MGALNSLLSIVTITQNPIIYLGNLGVIRAYIPSICLCYWAAASGSEPATLPLLRGEQRHVRVPRRTVNTNVPRRTTEKYLVEKRQKRSDWQWMQHVCVVKSDLRSSSSASDSLSRTPADAAARPRSRLPARARPSPDRPTHRWQNHSHFYTKCRTLQ